MNFHLSRYLLVSLFSIFNVIDCPAQSTLKESIQSNDLKKVSGILQVSPGAANACLDAQTSCTKPLYLAVKHRLPEMTQLLIKGGADVNFKTGDDRMPPLCLAVQLGFTEIAEILLKSGAKVNDRTNNYQMHEYLSPLDLAARSGHLGLIKLLLSNQAELNTNPKIQRINRGSYTPPLAHAIANNHLEAILLLINNGAKVDEVGELVYEHLATQRFLAKSIEAAEILVAKGIKIRKSDQWGKPVEIAFGGKEPASPLSVFIGNFVESKILYAAINGDSVEVGKLLAKNPSLSNERSKSGYTPLYYAAKWGHKAVVEQLLSTGADVNVRVNGKTASQVAANDEISNLLLAKGATRKN